MDEFILAHNPDQLVFSKDHLQDIQFCVTGTHHGESTLGINGLSGDPKFLHEIFRRYPSKISKHLGRLSIFPMSAETSLMEVTSHYMNVMLDELHTNYPQPPLPSVKVIKQAFTHFGAPFLWDKMDSGVAIEQMVRLVDLAPDSLESFSGGVLPIPGLTPEKLAGVFERAAKIKEIYIAENLVAQHGGIYEYALRLGQRCPTLKEIVFEDFGGMQVKLNRLVIVRDRGQILDSE